MVQAEMQSGKKLGDFNKSELVNDTRGCKSYCARTPMGSATVVDQKYVPR